FWSVGSNLNQPSAEPNGPIVPKLRSRFPSRRQGVVRAGACSSLGSSGLGMQLLKSGRINEQPALSGVRGPVFGAAVLAIVYDPKSITNFCGVCFQQALHVEAFQLRRPKAFESLAAIADTPDRRRQTFTAFAAYVPAHLLHGKFGEPEQSRQPSD